MLRMSAIVYARAGLPSSNPRPTEVDIEMDKRLSFFTAAYPVVTYASHSMRAAKCLPKPPSEVDSDTQLHSGSAKYQFRALTGRS